MWALAYAGPQLEWESSMTLSQPSVILTLHFHAGLSSWSQPLIWAWARLSYCEQLNSRSLIYFGGGTAVVLDLESAGWKSSTHQQFSLAASLLRSHCLPVTVTRWWLVSVEHAPWQFKFIGINWELPSADTVSGTVSTFMRHCNSMSGLRRQCPRWSSDLCKVTPRGSADPLLPPNFRAEAPSPLTSMLARFPKAVASHALAKSWNRIHVRSEKARRLT